MAKVDSRIYFIAIEKNNSDIDKEFKNSILIELLKHILLFGNLPTRIIADKQYFKDSKVAYFTAREVKEIVTNSNNPENENTGKRFMMQTLTKEEYCAKGRESCLIEIGIEHHNSKLSEELQALDLISGSIFSKFEHQNSIYWDVLQKKSIKIKGNIIKR